MKTAFWMLGLAGVSLMVLAGSGRGARIGKDGGEGGFEMYVAPNMIVKSAPCLCVTIHTEVGYNAASNVSATVDDEPVNVAGTFPDSRGNLVVKLSFGEVADIAEVPAVRIGLKLTANGEDLSATVTVSVKE